MSELATAWEFQAAPTPTLEVLRRLDRIEALLIRLLEALADEGEEDQPTRTLDGEQAGSERDQTRSLDAG